MKVKDLQESEVPKSPPPAIPEDFTESEVTCNLSGVVKSDQDSIESNENNSNECASGNLFILLFPKSTF